MLHLLNLPDIVIEKILLYLCYDEIARLRTVCRQFDTVCKQLLNKGFISAERYHSHCLKSVKSLLPRRESERRSHPMSRHCDILTAIETRISMLSMTFMKYVDFGMCCFIPGKVIDEIFRVLHMLRTQKTLPRAHELLQELRDISSMAMEHFDEKIVPGLKQKVALSGMSSNFTESVCSSILGCSTRTSAVFTQEKIRVYFHELHSCTRRNKAAVDKLSLKVKRQNVYISLLASKLRDQAVKASQRDSQIADLKKHLEELEHKHRDLAAELSRSREDSPSVPCGAKRKLIPILEDSSKKFKSEDSASCSYRESDEDSPKKTDAEGSASSSYQEFFDDLSTLLEAENAASCSFEKDDFSKILQTGSSASCSSPDQD